MAMPAKGKEPASDTIMSPGEMKPLLALSKREPVNAAIGITADGEGIILLNKKVKSKRVLAMLKAQAAKAKIQLQPSTLRFGKAEVDTDYDAGMVRFFVNKEAPGNMRVKLLEVIKRVPYQKVEINIDTSFEDESENDEVQTEVAAVATSTAPPEAPPPPPPPPPPQTGTSPDNAGLIKELMAHAHRIPEVPDTDPGLKARLVKLANDAGAHIKANSLDDAANAIAELGDALRGAFDTAKAVIGQVVAPQDAAALIKELSALARRIPGVPDTDPGLKARLVTFATDANASIKANNLSDAAVSIAHLRTALDEVASGTPGAGAGQPVNWDALRRTWRSASDAADQQISALQAALRQSGNDSLEEIAEFGMNDITGNHKVRLMAAMVELGSGDPAAIAKSNRATLDIARQFHAFLDSDERVMVCDENPLGVPVSLRTTLGGALIQLEAALQNAA